MAALARFEERRHRVHQVRVEQPLLAALRTVLNEDVTDPGLSLTVLGQRVR
jgi:hypothetical protein